MVRRKESGSVPVLWWFILGFLFILLLKTNKVLPDPPSLDLAAGITLAATIVGIFAYQVKEMYSIHGRVSRLEASVERIEKELVVIKDGLQHVRDTVNQVIGRLNQS